MTLLNRVQYHYGVARPALKLWLPDDDGTLIDMSSGYTFSLKIGAPGSTALLTKSSSIVGAAGSGIEPTGVPNCVVTWGAGELAIAVGAHLAQLTATTGALPRIFEFPFDILEVIS